MHKRKGCEAIRTNSRNRLRTSHNSPLHTMAYQALALADVSVTAKGAKMAILSDGGERCYYTFPSPTQAPFGPSNFDKDPNATRQNLEVRVSGDTAAYFEGLDAWAIDVRARFLSTTPLFDFFLRFPKVVTSPILRCPAGPWDATGQD
jgi:hypothetical protein